MNKIKIEYKDWDEFEEVEDQLVDQTRWATVHTAILKKDGKYYEVTYSTPSTETSGDFEDVNSWPIEGVQVHRVERTVVREVWEPVP